MILLLIGILIGAVAGLAAYHSYPVVMMGAIDAIISLFYHPRP